MNQRLIWNFEFSTEKCPSLGAFTDHSDSIKWEIRYFWAKDEIITLYNIDEGLLNINLYKHKTKEDGYYLIPTEEFNIKYRKNKLLYKPLIKKAKQAIGFGAKVNLQEDSAASRDLLLSVQRSGTPVIVQKTSFTYKFATTPTVTLELAQLKVHDELYFSVCIEGRSLALVEAINQQLLDNQTASNYVTFLKQISTP